jgi:hypothetical protein
VRTVKTSIATSSHVKMEAFANLQMEYKLAFAQAVTLEPYVKLVIILKYLKIIF